MLLVAVLFPVLASLCRAAVAGAVVVVAVSLPCCCFSCSFVRRVVLAVLCLLAAVAVVACCSVAVACPSVSVSPTNEFPLLACSRLVNECFLQLFFKL